jgi:prophage regulatory protein
MASTTTNNTPKTFIKLPAVKERTSLSTSEIYRRIEAGTFPAQIKLGAKAVAWLEHEIDEWIKQTIEAGRAAIDSEVA